jgi:phospholysine phosphohistidine inorganic pyrophosphate phosphatase
MSPARRPHDRAPGAAGGSDGHTIRAVLLDLDGTLYGEAGPVPGAAGALAALRRRGVPLRFVTNTTRRSRGRLAERLAGYGLDARPEEIITAVMAAVALLRERAVRRVAPFVAAATLEDLAAFDLAGERPEVVLVGDLGEEWDFAALNRAFHHLMEGADLVALQRDRYWQKGDVLALDAGPFVAALEYATGRTATVTGKPSPAFYHAALATLRTEGVTGPDGVIMVGDDLWGDIQGAHGAGLQAWLVRTGKYREEVYAQSGIVADRVIASVAELPGLV